ncbi:protein PYRICULARIA ORYZAE RESISTANCE 21-like [Dendrobium catenatum]|uniref:HMA domain-containing protein n=1 Tax=Dendrobium catenatum TaxID=906689 RepID=A0A2I0XA36_9ASPA|nr:protein PYRICULARIA ORYZAE RESISTANCE 21-like [Dendrobium catenatum]PKU84779.1 hypothetical protein MA16_Dca008189 [Dendrobium catenatum]
MAGGTPTLILTVDLECRLCSKKIKKAICKLQERERIQKIEYDEKKNTVTISGPFDPVKLKNKLCCKACEAIKNINIIEPTPPPPPPPPPPPRKPEPVYLPFWPVGPPIPVPVCHRRPCYVGCNDICRSCNCGCGGVGPCSLPVVGKPVTYQFSFDCEGAPAPPQCSVM